MTACPGTTLPTVTNSQLRQVMFDETNSSTPSVASTYNQCSYNTTKITTATSNVTGLVVLPCNGTK